MSETNGRLRDRVALVTGATQGLGADIARALIDAGAHVFLVGRSVDAGEAVARALGERACFVRADITDDADIDRCVERACRVSGHIDVVVNNACSYDDAGLASTREQWRRTLDVNLVSAAMVTQKASVFMRRGAVVINLGSTGGKFGAGGRAVYPASKAALIQITRNFAVALAPQGVRVLSVSPAWTWSPAVERMSAGSTERADRVGAHFHPLGRVGRGDEVGKVVVFAASEDASWMTGVDLAVDGGFSILGPDQGISPGEWFARLGGDAGG